MLRKLYNIFPFNTGRVLIYNGVLLFYIGMKNEGFIEWRTVCSGDTEEQLLQNYEQFICPLWQEFEIELYKL